MFTGIVQDLGTVVAVDEQDGGVRLRVSTSLAGELRPGDSIAVNGCCLTAVGEPQALDGDAPGAGGEAALAFDADVMNESLRRTSLGAAAAVGARVNLELAMAAGERFGGHIVQGHVDGVSTLLQVRDEGSWRVLRFSLPDDLAPLVVDKGSIAVAGTSLTVSTVGRDDAGHWFEVSLIPETLTATTLGGLAAGARVNLETDVLARHVARMLALAPAKEGMA